MSGGFEVDTEVLRRHGVTGRAGGERRAHGAVATGSTDLHDGAFGVLCSFLPAIVGGVDSAAREALSAVHEASDGVVARARVDGPVVRAGRRSASSSCCAASGRSSTGDARTRWSRGRSTRPPRSVVRGVLESVTDLCSSLESGSWVAIGLAGVGAALDVAATVIDPLGSLIGAGLGWLMEHLEPLKGWLNDLTGDPGAVLGFAGTWQNVADAMGAAGDELTRVVRGGPRGDDRVRRSRRTRAYADALADRIRATGSSASAIGGALKTCAMVVQVVHDLVRDTLASLVGSIISWAAEAVFTLGFATPVIVGQVSTRVSSLAAKVGPLGHRRRSRRRSR